MKKKTQEGGPLLPKPPPPFLGGGEPITKLEVQVFDFSICPLMMMMMKKRTEPKSEISI